MLLNINVVIVATKAADNDLPTLGEKVRNKYLGLMR